MSTSILRKWWRSVNLSVPHHTFQVRLTVVAISTQFHPVPAEVAVYDELYSLYALLYGNLTAAFDQVAAFQREQEAASDVDLSGAHPRHSKDEDLETRT